MRTIGDDGGASPLPSFGQFSGDFDDVLFPKEDGALLSGVPTLVFASRPAPTLPSARTSGSDEHIADMCFGDDRRDRTLVTGSKSIRLSHGCTAHCCLGVFTDAEPSGYRLIPASGGEYVCKVRGQLEPFSPLMTSMLQRANPMFEAVFWRNKGGHKGGKHAFLDDVLPPSASCNFGKGLEVRMLHSMFIGLSLIFVMVDPENIASLGSIELCTRQEKREQTAAVDQNLIRLKMKLMIARCGTSREGNKMHAVALDNATQMSRVAVRFLRDEALRMFGADAFDGDDARAVVFRIAHLLRIYAAVLEDDDNMRVITDVTSTTCFIPIASYTILKDMVAVTRARLGNNVAATVRAVAARLVNGVDGVVSPPACG